jgi:hypothetical protein
VLHWVSPPLQETRGTSAFRYLLGTLALPSLNTKVGALALCRASHFVFACAMLVCGLTSVTAAADGFFGQRQSMKRPA